MKKILVLLLACLLMMTLFVGCGNTKNNESLKVAMDLKFPPFTYMDDDGNPAGLEAEIAQAFGEYLGRKVEIINTDFSMLITALETGEADIVINDMTIKEERKEKVDFSTPYLYGRTLALLNKDWAAENNITEDTTPEELFSKGARVVGLAGTISVSVPQSYGVQVNEMTEIASALMEINNGTADILVGANTIIGDHTAYPDTTQIYWGIPDVSESAMAVKKGNTELLEKANAFIATMYEADGLYSKLAPKYDKAIGEYLQDENLGLNYIINKPE